MPVQRLSKLPRPRVRLGYDLHRLRACECIVEKIKCSRFVPLTWCAPGRARSSAPHVCGEHIVACHRSVT